MVLWDEMRKEKEFLIWVVLVVYGNAEFFGSVGIEIFLGVFVAVGILCGQELIF